MKMPFDKNSHIRVVKTIAEGLMEAGALENYLELGVRACNCFNVVAPFAKTAYAVEIKAVNKKYMRATNGIYYGRSTNQFFMEIPNDLKFDLVFIDAQHKKDASLLDFANAFPHVSDNGIILLHDTYPPSKEFIDDHCNDCWETASEIRNTCKNDCEIVTLPFYYGITIVRKCNRQLMWK